MWLPLIHTSVSLWISLLTLCVTVDFPRSTPDLWFPYDLLNDFARNAEEFYQGSPSPYVRSTPSLLTCFRPSASEPKASGLSIQEKRALDYFGTLQPDCKAVNTLRMLLRDAMVYLARKEYTSLALLRLWKTQLDHIMHNGPTGEEATIIAYALYTLLLKNHGKADETGILDSILPEHLRRIQHWYAQSYPGPNGAPVWQREMFAPHTGLSTTLRSRVTFREQLQSEPTLVDISEALSEKRYVYVYHTLDDIIKKIFSSKPSPKLFSSHTRVAAIALLFHAMHNTNEHASLPAIKIAYLLLANERNDFFLFNHEKNLLRKLYDDYYDHGPNRQGPL